MGGFILNKLNKKLVELILSELMSTKLKVIGDKKPTLPGPFGKLTSQLKKCTMSNFLKRNNKPVKQWKNPKIVRKNKFLLVMRQLRSRNKRKSNKTNMPKKLKK